MQNNSTGKAVESKIQQEKTNSWILQPAARNNTGEGR